MLLLLPILKSSSDDGKFIGTNVLNERFKDLITFEQSYPNQVLKKILSTLKFGKQTMTFVKVGNMLM